MPHVCIDARLYNASGIGTFLKSALVSLSENSLYTLSLIYRKKDKHPLQPLASNLIEMDIPIYTVREQLHYRSLIPPCDLFWSPHFNVPLFPIRAKKRLVTICDAYHLAHSSTLSLKRKIYAHIMYNAALQLSDQVTTISEFSKKEILCCTFMKPKKNLLVVNPDLSHLIVESQSARTHNYILYVGNLKPHKNLVRLVLAYEQLRPSESLIIVGQKEGFLTFDKELFKVVEKSPFLQHNVRFMGYVSEERLQELYRGAKLLVFPSTYEGFGYPPLEAMAYGCPVVASQSAAIPEVCQDAVEYVNPFSIESIAAGMSRLLKDKTRRGELSRKGKELVEKKKSEHNLIVEAIHACCSHS